MVDESGFPGTEETGEDGYRDHFILLCLIHIHVSSIGS